MKDDAELLRKYVTDGTEAAFEELVARHVDLVYSAAVRQMGGDVQSAQDVMQMVFIDLARKARGLTHHNSLAGWLYTSVRYAAATVRRSNQRRQKHEWEARTMDEHNHPDADADWAKLKPILDESMLALGEKDRHAILLRFFERKTLVEVGHSLGMSESAARKRLERGLEKLRLLLKHRGITSTGAALGALLTAQAVTAAPPGAAAILTSTSLAAATASLGSAGSLLESLKLAKLQTTIVGLSLFLAGVATPVALNHSWSAAKVAIPPTGFQAANQQPGSIGPGVAPQAETNSPLGILAEWLRRADRGKKMYQGLPAAFDEDELRVLVWSLPAEDYPKAWHLGDNLHYVDLREHFGLCMLVCWSELDPRAALAAAVNLNNGWKLGAPLLVLESWARRDPTAALAWIRFSAPEKVYAKALSSVIPELAKRDPQAAIAALEEIPPGQRRWTAFSGAVQQWAGQAPSSAAKYVAGLPATWQRSELMACVSAQWAQKDPDAAFEWSQKLPSGRDREAALVATVSAASQASPDRAAGYVDQLGDPRLFPFIPDIMKNWAESDLSAAVQWAQVLWTKTDLAETSNHGPLGQATYSLLQEWCKKDAPHAAEFAAALADPAVRQDGIQAVVANWSGKDWQAAQNWANGLASGPARDAALKGLCQGLASWDAPRAADFVANLPPGDLQSEAAVELASNWAHKDPQAAAQWVGALPEGKTRERAAATVMEMWIASGSDAEAAARWLQQLPDGPTRNQAAQKFVGWAALVQPELASAWVNAVKDESERNQQIQVIARRWVLTDPEAARKWIQTTSLSDEKKHELMENENGK